MLMPASKSLPAFTAVAANPDTAVAAPPMIAAVAFIPFDAIPDILSIPS
nr:MAG TPA: hypothetical protein [Caudoviricetes sp.]